MQEYKYSGPVMIFDICVNPKWTATTRAPSESKARNNLTYRYKKTHNLVAMTRVTLPGIITLID